jgi:hypothetical protein
MMVLVLHFDQRETPIQALAGLRTPPSTGALRRFPLKGDINVQVGELRVFAADRLAIVAGLAEPSDGLCRDSSPGDHRLVAGDVAPLLYMA